MASALLFVSFVLATLALQGGPFRGRAPAERWFLAVSTALLVLALASLAALRVQHQSPWVVGSVLVVLAGAALWLRGRGEPASDAARGGEFLAAALVCLGALYAFYPNYFVLGGQDPGVYLLLSALGANTGGLDVDLPWAHAAWSESAGALAPGYPGIYSLAKYGMVAGGDRLSPQFMHLFPALASNAWAAGGLEAALRTNALLAVLALWGAFVLVRRLVSWPPALSLVLVLGLNPAFLWGARITLTEIMSLWLNVFGLVLLDCAQKSRSTHFAAGAGAVLGLGIFNRFDAGFIALAVLGFALAATAERPLRRLARVVALAYLVTAALGFADGKVSAPVYFMHMTTRHSLYELIGVTFGCAAMALAVTALPDRLVERLRATPKWFGVARSVGFGLLLLWTLGVLFVWPLLRHTPSALSARELTWYVTPLSWPLGLGGIALALRARSLGRWLPVLAFGCGTLVVYTARTGVAHEHIWASRRWLPSVIPFLLLFSSAAGDFILRAIPRRTLRFGAGFALLAGYFVPALDFARPFLFRSMLAGLPEAYARFVQHVRSAEVRTPLVTENVQLASILTYVYDVPTMLLSFDGHEALARGDLAGRFGVGFGPFGLGGVTEYDERFAGRYLEITPHRPRALIDTLVPFDIGRIGGATFEIEVAAGDPIFGTIVGRRTPAGTLQTTRQSGTLQNGPWIGLSPGQYEADWIGRVWAPSKHDQSGVLDVITSGGNRVLAQTALRIGPEQGREVWLGGVEFSAERPLTGVEFRIQVEADTELALTRVRLRRVAVPPPLWSTGNGR